MVRRRGIDAQPIGELYKRARHSDRISDHEVENLRKVRLILVWESIPKGRTVHFWLHRETKSGLTVSIPMAPPKVLDLTIIGCLTGRSGTGKRFRVDVVYGLGPPGLKLNGKDVNALIKIITEKLQEEFPEKQITGITREIFAIEEQKAWDC
tara:strand:+ start:41 stop:496 length:456 start_codon:yes stop_codon:yes gene_type:complete